MSGSISAQVPEQSASQSGQSGAPPVEVDELASEVAVEVAVEVEVAEVELPEVAVSETPLASEVPSEEPLSAADSEAPCEALT